MGPLECSECPRECSGPFGIVTAVIYSIADAKWLEGSIRIAEFLLVLLMSAYFFFMARETVPVDMTSHISEVVDVRSDILFDLFVVLVRVVNAVPLSSS